MNRQDWKAFYHTLRADARRFHEIHGGYPSFCRYLTHNGQHWAVRRELDRHTGWTTEMFTVRHHTVGEAAATHLDAARALRNQARRCPWDAPYLKLRARDAITSHRAIRLAL